MKISRLYKASRQSKNSLKTTVPSFYVDLLKLNDQDSLEWDHTVSQDKIIVTVKKAKGASK
jgi:hypothetical protein